MMARRKRTGKWKSTFRELLLDHSKKLQDSENELAHLFRDILLTHGISHVQWDALADRYYRRQNTNSKGEVDLMKVNHDKSNMAKALARDTLPWRRFIVAVQILGPKSYKITLEMFYPDDLSFKHELLTQNRMAEPTAIEDDEDDKDE